MTVVAKALDVLRVCLLGLLFACSLAACSSDAPVAEADYPAKLVGDPLCRPANVGPAIGIGTDAWNANQVAEVVFEMLLLAG